MILFNLYKLSINHRNKTILCLLNFSYFLGLFSESLTLFQNFRGLFIILALDKTAVLSKSCIDRTKLQI